MWKGCRVHVSRCCIETNSWSKKVMCTEKAKRNALSTLIIGIRDWEGPFGGI